MEPCRLNCAWKRNDDQINNGVAWSRCAYTNWCYTIKFLYSFETTILFRYIHKFKWKSLQVIREDSFHDFQSHNNLLTVYNDCKTPDCMQYNALPFQWISYLKQVEWHGFDVETWWFVNVLRLRNTHPYLKSVIMISAVFTINTLQCILSGWNIYLRQIK